MLKKERGTELGEPAPPRNSGCWYFLWSFFGNAGLAPIVPLASSAWALQHLSCQGTQCCPGRAAESWEPWDGSVQHLGQGLDGGATVSQGPGKGNPGCASRALTGVSLASVETGLSRVPQGSRNCCFACEGAPGTARNLEASKQAGR